MEESYIITASCPDRVGLVAQVSGFIAQLGGWILESAYHADPDSGRYFMRVQIRAHSLAMSCERFREEFAPLARSLGMDWQVSDASQKKRVAILVSQHAHCLYDLLARWHNGDLPMDIACVISNHEQFREFVAWHGIDFHHLDMSAANPQGAFEKLHKIVQAARVDVWVLARFMQILPDDICLAYPGKIINIHHSFLPSFIGARPYHQAYERGVKLIGATCHYVTPQLDEGPIIEQDTIRVDHGDTVEDLVRYGKDIEKTVLARGLRYHLEDRVLLNRNKTIILR
jgi:formyltetrahydrofolate deformylase